MVQQHRMSPPRQQPRLLEYVREVIRTRHYSLRTEDTYVQWIKRFILFHDKRHPQTMGAMEVQQFLTDLAVTQHVAASTQNQALSALLFLYKEVLHQEIAWLDDVIRAKKPKKLPVVLTRDEVKRLLQHLEAPAWLMASLLYGAGLRLLECLRLRVKDVDFAMHQPTVREGKGAHDRVTMLPDSVYEPLLSISTPSNSSTPWTWRKAMGVSTYPMPWSGNIQTPPTTGSGNTSFQRPNVPSTPVVGSNGDTMCCRWGCNGR